MKVQERDYTLGLLPAESAPKRGCSKTPLHHPSYFHRDESGNKINLTRLKDWKDEIMDTSSQYKSSFPIVLDFSDFYCGTVLAAKQSQVASRVHSLERIETPCCSPRHSSKYVAKRRSRFVVVANIGIQAASPHRQEVILQS